ncbi:MULTISPECIES: hypothetical protein [Actinotignum]|uniref:Uncharacterized protein n=1 Tax=Actinotignum schaalii FB123-CNA-2 TaxID=883067 RepID=S2WHW6_9ACTO|nr:MULTISPECIES: hypothetical protein [Actinotignum]EPD27499.1 hypothetical protein HMPREF9237_00586 [Actinotignum schaalii FB123-CNA-2]MDY5128101.1 hypothetical protein [Actinotignum sp. SLA_B059]MDY5136398.1 hypothetical protein [Actinotignum sanguinis]MDY5139282.1 hypothetical protein [Actinotignum timonense]
MQPEENHAGNETSVVSAGNASNASHAGMDRNAGWDMLASFMTRMKQHEKDGTWRSYRPGEPETEDE